MPLDHVRRLLAGEQLIIDGLAVSAVDDADGSDIKPGDRYVGERNSCRLLTCKFLAHSAVFPVERGYPYDEWECVPVTVHGLAERAQRPLSVDEQSAIADAFERIQKVSYAEAALHEVALQFEVSPDRVLEIVTNPESRADQDEAA
jgi:hypothetical protein